MDLAINNVTDLCNFVGKMVCVCVCVCVCVWERERESELLSHFLPIKINLTNILPILIKMVDLKNLAWATSFATRASRKFIYLPYKASGKKSYWHTLVYITCMFYVCVGVGFVDWLEKRFIWLTRRVFEMCIWQSLIVLKCPCVVDSMSKSSY